MYYSLVSIFYISLPGDVKILKLVDMAPWSSG